MSNTIEKRQHKEKDALIEQFKKTPVVQVACEKTGVSRATYYRWREKDAEFAARSDNAIGEGNALVSDMAESQLMSAIRDKNMTAIIFWLKHHHPTYATKVEVTARLKQDNERLTPEQDALITKALKLAALMPEVNITENSNSSKV